MLNYTLFTQYPLTILIFSPLIGIFFLLFLDKEKSGLSKTIGLLSTILTFLISLYLLSKFSLFNSNFQFQEIASWIPFFGIKYHIGIDGISIYLLLLTSFLLPMTILGTWKSITFSSRDFMICLLLFEMGLLGVFSALDVFLFYIFWEIVLIPMFLLICSWGNKKKQFASIKFFIYTMLGSVLMLVAIIIMAILYQQKYGVFSFNLLDWYHFKPPILIQFYLFLGFAIAFAIKIPIFPLHTWKPITYAEAPTAGTVLLAGIMLKMGCYGFIRFAIPLFPQATQFFLPYLQILSVIGIIYGALLALVQKDMKRLLAYSSLSHLGLIMLGMFSLNIQGMQGSILQMLNHGMSTAALFLAVGMLCERNNSTLIQDYKGIVHSMPMFSIVFMILVFSSIGLPGLNGFIGEFTILIGAFQSNLVITIIATTGVILSAVYLLWLSQRILFGKESTQKLPDLNFREIVVFIPFIFFIIFIGVYPQPFFEIMEASINKMMLQQIVFK